MGFHARPVARLARRGERDARLHGRAGATLGSGAGCGGARGAFRTAATHARSPMGLPSIPDRRSTIGAAPPGRTLEAASSRRRATARRERGAEDARELVLVVQACGAIALHGGRGRFAREPAGVHRRGDARARDRVGEPRGIAREQHQRLAEAAPGLAHAAHGDGAPGAPEDLAADAPACDERRVQSVDDELQLRPVRRVHSRAEVGDAALGKEPAVAAGNARRKKDVRRRVRALRARRVTWRVSTSAWFTWPIARPASERGPSAPTITFGAQRVPSARLTRPSRAMARTRVASRQSAPARAASSSRPASKAARSIIHPGKGSERSAGSPST